MAALLVVGCAEQKQTSDIALKDAYADSFKIGCAVDPFTINGRSPEAEALLLKHFNAITTNNNKKRARRHPRT